MGNYVKYFYHDNDIENMGVDIHSPTGETIYESMHTPSQKNVPIDPRSVTTGIDRTSIEINCTPARINKWTISPIPKHLQRKLDSEADITEMVCLSPVKRAPKLADIVQLEFTDMQKENVDDYVISKEVISSIEKDRFEILGLDPRSPVANFDRTPVLTPSSMRLLRARYLQSLNKMGSYETDADCPTISYCETLSQFDIPEIQVLPDLAACLGDSLDSRHSSRTERISNNEACLENGNSNNANVQIVNESTSELQKEEVIIVFDDDSVAEDTLSLNIIKPQKDKQKTEINGKKTKLVKSEVKSLGDEKKIINSNNKNAGNESIKIRTPLGNRSNKGQIHTGTTKSPQPMFRSKSIVPKQLQENTPPHKSYVAKSKLGSIQKDPDSAFII